MKMYYDHIYLRSPPAPIPHCARHLLYGTSPQFFAYLVYHAVGDGPYLRGQNRLTNDEPVAHRIGDILRFRTTMSSPLPEYY